jgi:hypothetical protein
MTQNAVVDAALRAFFKAPRKEKESAPADEAAQPEVGTATEQPPIA